jgi:hypothetical protein
MYRIGIIISFILLSGMILFAKNDSTKITIKVGFNDNEINILADLMDIEKITISFSDTNLIGKKFILTKAEYVNAIKKEEFELVKCSIDTIKTMVGEDTINYIIDQCQRITYSENDTSYSIHFLCDNSKSDTAKIMVRYPYIRTNFFVEKKDESYSLRDLIACGDYTGNIPLNQKIPVIAFAPPFDMGSGAKGYCILNIKPVDEWNKYYNLKHYVVIYLEIKD